MLNNSNLGMKTFYRLIIVQVLSVITSQMSGFAIALWVTRETGNATPLALTAFFGTLPQILLSNIAGWAADRFDRRYVMALADGGQAIGTLLLLASFLSGQFQIWHLYAVSLIGGCFAVFQWPAAEASVTMLVTDEHRNRVNSIRQMVGPVASIIAPAATGLLFGLLNVTGIIVLDLLTFLIAVVVTLTANIPRPVRKPREDGRKESFWQSLTGGFRFVWDKKPLLALMLYLSAINFLFTAGNVLFIPYALGRTGSESTTGLVSSTIGAGMLVGGLLFGLYKGNLSRVPTFLAGIGFACVFFGLHGVAQSVPMLLITGFVFTLPIIPMNALFSAMMQSKVPPDVQGRVFALLGQLSMLMSPLGLLLIGPLADRVFKPLSEQPFWTTFAPIFGTGSAAGFGLLFAIVGTLGVLLTLVVAAIPRIRNVEHDLPDYVVEQENTPVSTPNPEPIREAAVIS